MNQTLDQYLKNAHIESDLETLILSLSKTCAKISHAVSLGALSGVLGSADTENVQGETQKKLDILANQWLLDEQQANGTLAGIASEEMETIYPVPESVQKGAYLLLFDPLDGSSNIDVNVSIGTIFSVLRSPNAHPTEADFLQAGIHQIAAGYVLYGPQTMLVLTLGKGVSGFTFNRDDQQWYLTTPEYRIPQETKEFAINMSNMRHWAPEIRAYIQDCLAGETGPLAKNYNMRWIASMVTDVHRILTRGGVFAYPWDKREPSKAGKLRLMYEANPMSFLVEQAGGQSIYNGERILTLTPTALHQRIPVILGSSHEIDTIKQYLNASN